MRLNNARWEMFAQHVAFGMAAGRAYEAAGFEARGNAADAAASRLLRNGKVKARIEELQAESATTLSITKERITQMLFEDRAFAVAVGNAATARAASVDIGRLHGFSFADKTAEMPTEALPQPVTGSLNVLQFRKVAK